MNGRSAASQYNGTVARTMDVGSRWVSARSQFFRVDVFGVNLGMFSKCEGLGAQVMIDRHEEGGTNGFAYTLGGRIKYSNVKITRPVNSHSAGIGTLFAAMNDPTVPRTATIVAMADGGDPLAAWLLLDVTLVQWQGPTFNTDSSSAVTETLEFAHQGFGAP
jgi:phage tail-like protein